MSAALLKGELGKKRSELVKAAPVFNILTQLGNLLGRNANAAILPVLPALVLEIRTTPDGPADIGRGLSPAFFCECAALEGGDLSEFDEGGLAICFVFSGSSHEYMVSSYLDTFKSKKKAPHGQFKLFCPTPSRSGASF